MMSPGVHHVFLALRINFRFSLSNPRDLLVGVVMQRHPRALFHDPFCESGLRAVQILPLDQRRHLLDRLSVQMVERETGGHMTADHRQYAFAGRVSETRNAM